MPVTLSVSDKSALRFDALCTRSNMPSQARAKLLVLREISYFSDQQSQQAFAFGSVKRCFKLLLKLRNVSLEGGYDPVLANPVFQAFGKQRALSAIRSLNEASHLDPSVLVV
jgi:hypothetical protein